MQSTISLVNELKLGERLNLAVGANRRGEFGLLLALLSANTAEMAQFQHQKSSTAQHYRAQFTLAPEQLLLADLNNDATVVDNSAAFHHAGTEGFRLQDGLTQEALVIRKGEGEEMQAVMANCDYHTRKRAEKMNNPVGVKAAALIEQLTTQRQMSQILLQV
ncbi:VC2046/SO_2500 family protein [Shewanella surugensis]|uniref:QueD-like protein n=1 Tax=Shewanella surugensis TaxID=212020 RepID=A0ABT0L959_9GAMM|nr:VC2046/SO_2500 family protein [Shewanella surugensis]MCL1124248.1 queD-like protein [Shewanella surugensis]